MCLLLGVYGTAEVLICYLEDYQNLGLETCNGYKLRWPVCLLFFIPGGLYFCTRLCLIFEIILSMFSLPAEHIYRSNGRLSYHISSLYNTNGLCRRRNCCKYGPTFRPC